MNKRGGTIELGVLAAPRVEIEPLHATLERALQMEMDMNAVTF